MEYIRAELKPTRVVGSAATLISTGRSFLGSIRLNALSSTIYIFDAAATTSAVVAVTASAIAVISSSTLVLANDFNYVMANGIVVTGGTPTTDFTVTSANN